MELVQKRDDLGGIAPVVDHQNIRRDGLDKTGRHKGLGHLAGVQAGIHRHETQQVAAQRQPRGGHPVVLVAVPARRVPDPGTVRQPESRAVRRPEPKAPPASWPEALEKSGRAVPEKILEKNGEQFFPRLGERALAGGKRRQPQKLEKRVQLHRVAAFEQAQSKKNQTLERQQAAAGEIFAGTTEIAATMLESGKHKGFQSRKIKAKVGRHD